VNKELKIINIISYRNFYDYDTVKRVKNMTCYIRTRRVVRWRWRF